EMGMSRPYCVGAITPGVQVKIVDEEGGELGPEEIGEIIIAGPNVMKGYWRNPEQTAEVLRDGWFYTGDLGKIDAEGYLYVMGRKKDMIIVGGHNVYAAEVESVLLRHPAVAEVAVIGVADPVRGEAVKAVVVPHEGQQVTAVELSELARKHLASYKVPKVYEFRESLPVSRTGKINKQQLREEPLYEEWVT
ncbi:MAG: AMP-binding protein, partial [Armatimonadetes bacterium]|nr:AMP-binding protein [Armatimonadota bacterium]